MMQRFWTIEEMNNQNLTKEERACEKDFELNTRRLETGRYIVKLPLSDSPDILGDSYHTARAKFLLLEQRLLKNTEAATANKILFTVFRRISTTWTRDTSR